MHKFMLVTGLCCVMATACKHRPAYDQITIDNKSDSLIYKIKVYVANDPREVYFHDGKWFGADSIPLRTVLSGKAVDTISRNYRNATLYITYGDQYFYDIELNKDDSLQAYDMHFQFHPIHDSIFLLGNIDRPGDRVIRFRDPMFKLYHQFILTYNHKEPADSTTLSDSIPVTKTITIIEN